MKRFFDLLKLFPIIAIASVAAMTETHAATKVTATPEGIIIKEIPKCEKQSPKQCRIRVKAVFPTS